MTWPMNDRVPLDGKVAATGLEGAGVGGGGKATGIEGAGVGGGGNGVKAIGVEVAVVGGGGNAFAALPCKVRMYAFRNSSVTVTSKWWPYSLTTETNIERFVGRQ